MPIKTYSLGYRSAELQSFLRPNRWKGDGTVPGVICAPGRGAGATQPTTSNYFAHVTYALARQGFPVLSIQGGSSLFAWGNPDSVAAVEAGRTYLQGTLGAKAGGVYLLGISMGCLALLNWGRANPTLVKAAALTIPAISLANHYSADNPAGAAAQITTAYGGAPPASSDPLAQASEVTFPCRFYTSSNDTSCPPAYAAALAAAMPGEDSQYDTGAWGHSPGATPASNVVDYFVSHLA